MAKLGTQFQPIVNPANTRLLTLIDESTGLRYKINIAEFFDVVASGATFSDQLSVSKAGASGLRLISTDAINGFINFGDTEDDNIGRIFYDHATNAMSFRTNTVDQLAIASTGDATFSGGVKLGANNQAISGFTTGAAETELIKINPANQVQLSDDGGTRVVFIPSLAGTGTRAVMVSPSGVLSAP